jgi:hypothetical protein
MTPAPGGSPERRTSSAGRGWRRPAAASPGHPSAMSSTVLPSSTGERALRDIPGTHLQRRSIVPSGRSLTQDGKDSRLQAPDPGLQKLLNLKPGVWSLEPRQPSWFRLRRIGWLTRFVVYPTRGDGGVRAARTGYSDELGLGIARSRGTAMACAPGTWRAGHGARCGAEPSPKSRLFRWSRMGSLR